ncbi:MAG: hypothetical protein G8345_04775 [Magnetococcales bacterium]|nr:hypothetical protein [Magnetococcales bacterium]NGZ26184.1 hypothetical protein [Magnetococcales bacterium]
MSISEVLQGLAAILGIFYTIRIYRQARDKYPVFRYDQHSTSNQEDWRWRLPDEELNLILEEDKEVSRIHIPVHFLFFEKLCIYAGFIAAVFVIYLYGLLIVRDAGLPEYFIGLLFVFLSVALLNVGSRVSSISLHRSHLVVAESYALFLKRFYLYKHSQQLEFTGKVESIFELTMDHEAPGYNLYIIRRYLFIFRTKRKLILSINQSQGSWLVAGLEYWRDHSGVQSGSAVNS